MKTVEAVAIIAKLKQQDNKLCALPPENFVGSGLKARRVLRNTDTGSVIFYYVDRLELIDHLAAQHDLHPKGTNLCRILNS